MAINTWNQTGTTWGQNQWGDQADVDVSLTGALATDFKTYSKCKV